MTVGVSPASFPSSIGRFAVKLPYHEDPSEHITLGILALFDRLRSLPTLEPDAQNGKLFNQLFDLVTISKTTVAEEEKILSDPRIAEIVPQLWQIWGDAEYLLERDFARKVITGNTKPECHALFNTFPYLDQYRQLARMESNTIDTALGEKELPPIRKMMFLGSGPTPFSALCFRERFGTDVEIMNVDRNPDAIWYGKKMTKGLGWEGTVKFWEADVKDLGSENSGRTITNGNGHSNENGHPNGYTNGRSHEKANGINDTNGHSDGHSNGLNGHTNGHVQGPPNLKDYDVVHFAAMIGSSVAEKRQLLISVAKAMRPGALILIRSTDSLRTVLYPRMEVDDQDILEHVTPVVATRYYGKSTSLTAIIVSVDG